MIDERNWRVVLRGERVQRRIEKVKLLPGEREVTTRSGFFGEYAEEDGVYFPDDCLFLTVGDLAAMARAVREEPARREFAEREQVEGRRDC